VIPAVWITRPRPAAERTRAALEEAGYLALDVPLLCIAFEMFGRVPEGPWPDLLVLVSANAADGLIRAADRLGPPPSPVPVAAVGERTRERILNAPFPVTVIAVRDHAEALGVELAKLGLGGKRIWIPAGDREGSAHAFLPEFLRMAGASVETFGVYRNLDREPEAQERVRLQTADPGAVVLHSPSGAAAFRRLTASGPLVPWWSAPAVALGPTTARRLQDLDCPHVRLSPTPSDGGVLSALAGISRLRPVRET